MTGKRSMVTVIDVDGDYEWMEAFDAKYKLPETTKVMTPSGGYHLYYDYDCRLGKVSTKGWNNAKFGAEHDIDIDCRNDDGLI